MFDFDAKTGEIWIYDEITPPGYGGIDAGTVIAAMKKIGNRAMSWRFNTPGGDVDEGIAIHNAAKRHAKPITMINDSLCASIGHYIFMAGDERLVAKNSRSMIHEPRTRPIRFLTGDELRQLADQTDDAKDVLTAVYLDAMTVPESEVKRLLKEETWMNADRSLSMGLATGFSGGEAVEPLKIAAKMFKNTPKDLIKPALAAGAKNPYSARIKHYERLAAKARAEFG